MSWSTDDAAAPAPSIEDAFYLATRKWHFRVNDDWDVNPAVGSAWHGLTELVLRMYEPGFPHQEILDRLVRIEAFSLEAIDAIFSYDRAADNAIEKQRTRTDCRTARRLLDVLADADADIPGFERVKLAEVCRSVLQSLYARTRRQAHMTARP